MKKLLLIFAVFINLNTFSQEVNCDDIFKVETYSVDLNDTTISLFSSFKTDSIIFNNFFDFVLYLIDNNQLNKYCDDNFFDGSDYLTEKIIEKNISVTKSEALKNPDSICYLFFHEIKNSKQELNNSLVCIEALNIDLKYVFSIYVNTIDSFLQNTPYFEYIIDRQYSEKKFNELPIFSEIEEVEAKEYPEVNFDKVKRVDFKWVEVKKEDPKNYDLFYPEKDFFRYMNLIDAILYGVHKAGLTPYENKNNDITKDSWIITEYDLHNSLGMIDKLDSLPQNYKGNFSKTTIYSDGISEYEFYYNDIGGLCYATTIYKNGISSFRLIVFENENFIVFNDNDTLNRHELKIAKEYYTIPYNSLEITSFIFKEVWFYGKNNKVISKQLLAICPIREYIDLQTNEKKKDYTFWTTFSEEHMVLGGFATVTSDCNKYYSLKDYLIDGKYSGKIIKTEKIKLADYLEYLSSLQY